MNAGVGGGMRRASAAPAPTPLTLFKKKQFSLELGYHMEQHRNMIITPEDIRLLEEAMMLLLVVKRASRSYQDAKLVEKLTDKLLGENEADGLS